MERELAPLAQHAPQKFGDKLKLLVQLIGVFCRLLRSSIKVCSVTLSLFVLIVLLKASFFTAVYRTRVDTMDNFLTQCIVNCASAL